VTKRRAEARKRAATPGPDTLRQRWAGMLKKIVSALVLTTSGALLVTYNDALSSIVKPTFVAAWAWTQDRLSPMESGKRIAVELRFFIPSTVDKERSFEAVSATFSAERCKRPGGASITRWFDGGARDSYTNAIVSISCRASGRTLVKLTPQSGAPVTLYDDIYKDGDKVPFPGIPGSYYAGMLTMYFFDEKMPSGPWVPVNKCQTTNTCAEELFGDQARANERGP
jgi:hypothetical protein